MKPSSSQIGRFLLRAVVALMVMVSGIGAIAGELIKVPTRADIKTTVFGIAPRVPQQRCSFFLAAVADLAR